MLTDAIRKEGVQGLTLLDIGGGLGAVQHALIEAGVQQVVSVEASSAYIQAAEEELRRRGEADRVSIRHGDFVALAEEIVRLHELQIATRAEERWKIVASVGCKENGNAQPTARRGFNEAMHQRDCHFLGLD